MMPNTKRTAKPISKRPYITETLKQFSMHGPWFMLAALFLLMLPFILASAGTLVAAIGKLLGRW